MVIYLSLAVHAGSVRVLTSLSVDIANEVVYKFQQVEIKIIYVLEKIHHW